PPGAPLRGGDALRGDRPGDRPDAVRGALARVLRVEVAGGAAAGGGAGMTACPTPETLAALLDGELTKNQADAVREHAAGCASCRAQEAHLQKLTSALSRLELPADEAFVQ